MLYTDADFMDDVTGQVLDKEEAMRARKTEMQFFKQRGVYTKVAREGWMKVISTKSGRFTLSSGKLNGPNSCTPDAMPNCEIVSSVCGMASPPALVSEDHLEDISVPYRY